jgi:hypothetical protein
VIVLWILVCLFLSFILVLLWTPLRLVIDSKRDVYQVEWQYIGSATLVEYDNFLGVRIQIFFLRKIIPIAFSFKQKKEVKPAVKKQVRKGPSVFSARFRSKFIKILKSFEIKRLKINWDTDDYILNAYLYPITPFLITENKSFNINFEGKQEVELIIENRLVRILKSFF